VVDCENSATSWVNQWEFEGSGLAKESVARFQAHLAWSGCGPTLRTNFDELDLSDTMPQRADITNIVEYRIHALMLDGYYM